MESLVSGSVLATFKHVVGIPSPSAGRAPSPSYPGPPVGFPNLQNMVVASSDHFDAKWLFGDLDFIGQGSSSTSLEGLDMFMGHFIPVIVLVS